LVAGAADARCLRLAWREKSKHRFGPGEAAARDHHAAADVHSAFLPAGLDIDGAHRTADLIAAQRQRPRVQAKLAFRQLTKSRVQRLDQTTDVGLVTASDALAGALLDRPEPDPESRK